MLFYPSKLSFSIFSVADHLRRSDMITICHVSSVNYNLELGTQQYNIISAFELPTLSMASGQNGRRVTVVYNLLLLHEMLLDSLYRIALIKKLYFNALILKNPIPFGH